MFKTRREQKIIISRFAKELKSSVLNKAGAFLSTKDAERIQKIYTEEGGLLHCVKEIKHVTGLGLKEAKDSFDLFRKYVDYIRAKEKHKK